ncbi:hypothetical protein DFP72DRAFT_8486 [Ephemerocybe angulata]|uniref:Uncharacterized protein n=1 Tax=Ephemerocybe angulata TaxID=980116 RepID=A0A8H6IL57_9AGAR|nr:hypothetical protein DFP72DRAFT_8486 [Tulosesus angulatus]
MVALFVVLSFFSLSISSVFAFTFTSGSPSQCDALTIEWQGGKAPFELLFVPLFGTPQNVSIPDSAFADGKGSFSTIVLFPEKQRLVLTMSDSTGFGTGGTTDVMTVAQSKGGTCDSSDRGVAFPFQLNSALTQCRPFTFEGYGAAVQPITIWAVIPGGQPTVLHPPSGNTFSWTANVAAGTSMIFLMTDAQGRQGGASDIKLVGASDDSSCINGNSPSSTLKPTSASSTASQTSSTSKSTETPSSSATPNNGLTIGAIAGTVIGSLLFLAVIVTLGLFFLKSMKKKSDKRKTPPEYRHSRRMPSDGTFFDRAPNPHGPPNPMPPAHYPYSPNTAVPLDNPFADSTQMSNLTPADPNAQFAYRQQPEDPFQGHTPHYPYPPPTAAQDPFNPGTQLLPGAMAPLPPAPWSESGRTAMSQESISTSSSQVKAGDAGASAYTPAPSRFRVHNKDPEDDMPAPSTDGVGEIPAQYAERRRRPSRGLSVTNPSPREPR